MQGESALRPTTTSVMHVQHNRLIHQNALGVSTVPILLMAK